MYMVQSGIGFKALEVSENEMLNMHYVAQLCVVRSLWKYIEGAEFNLKLLACQPAATYIQVLPR